MRLTWASVLCFPLQWILSQSTECRHCFCPAAQFFGHMEHWVKSLCVLQQQFPPERCHRCQQRMVKTLGTCVCTLAGEGLPAELLVQQSAEKLVEVQRSLQEGSPLCWSWGTADAPAEPLTPAAGAVLCHCSSQAGLPWPCRELSFQTGGIVALRKGSGFLEVIQVCHSFKSMTSCIL